MQVKVLGSGAGGGSPQWNCGCVHCHAVRQGKPGYQRRTQSSIAVSVDGERWLLINASPDILQQIQNTPALWPTEGTRHSPIAGVLLTDAQVDHSTGLMMLREGCPIDVYATEPVLIDLSSRYPLLTTLQHWNGGCRTHRIETESEFSVAGIEGLRINAVPLHSNAPPFSLRRDHPDLGDNIGLELIDEESGQRIFYAPGLCTIDTRIDQCFTDADCVLVDGTFWHNDEMAAVGLKDKPAKSMGHIPLSGHEGLIWHLNRHSNTRKVLIHINNTNPILNEFSEERALLTASGIEVAEDGMLINPAQRVGREFPQDDLLQSSAP